MESWSVGAMITGPSSISPSLHHSITPYFSHGPKNQSHRSARRRQQGLALEVVFGEEGIRQAARRRPGDPRPAQEETGVGVGAANSHRTRREPLSHHDPDRP